MTLLGYLQIAHYQSVKLISLSLLPQSFQMSSSSSFVCWSTWTRCPPASPPRRQLHHPGENNSRRQSDAVTLVYDEGILIGCE